VRTGSAVVTSADLITGGDHSGCAFLIIAATPLTCAAATEAAFLRFASEPFTTPCGSDSVVLIRPGALTSGFRIPFPSSTFVTVCVAGRHGEQPRPVVIEMLS
jgi:hypothetical protein